MSETRPPDSCPLFDTAEAVIDYRGYRIELRLVGACGTYRVRRPDGSWRYILPSVSGMYSQEWVIFEIEANGNQKELSVVASAEEARRRIDTDLDARRLRCTAKQRRHQEPHLSTSVTQPLTADRPAGNANKCRARGTTLPLGTLCSHPCAPLRMIQPARPSYHPRFA